MIEATIISYLIDKTSAAKAVYAERPKNPPAKYIVIEKTGGGRVDRVDRATIAIQSIGACRLNSDYNFTDQTTKEYRYQAVFDITHY